MGPFLLKLVREIFDKSELIADINVVHLPNPED